MSGGDVLATARLRLRPPERNDVDALWPHLSNPAIPELLAWDPHPNRDSTMAMIDALRAAQEAGTGYHWLVEASSTVIGLVSLIDIRRRHLAWTLNRAELAFWIAPDAQRQGYATEASQAVMACGFGTLGLHKIRIGHAAANDASRLVCEKLGFTPYATERAAFLKSGKWHDLVWYDMLATEFDQ
ncbi:MAG: GNAT family N-acetyltransferase [Alphaproteobacteria bacterium]|nr:GNAT family N-acetyltransferase [Alphaproteobacteria bacterium]